MATWIEVEPAYGRDYKNQKEVKEAWAENLDFRETATGSYTNKQDAERLDLRVVVRYADSLKVVTVK
jgi:hypothetical protein